MKKILVFVAIALCLSSCGNKTEKMTYGSFELFCQSEGPTLGYSYESGVAIIESEGLFFKDHNRNGSLDVYEDWREDPLARSKDLASQMNIEQMCGLMLYSSHVDIEDTLLTEKVLDRIVNNDIRHILVTKVRDSYTAAVWGNKVQALAESLPLGIPCNNSSDPRNYTEADGEYNAGSGGDISHWPREIGMAATFDLDVVRRHGEIAAKEYRALGFTTTLSPQVDIATEPRWRRFYGSFGEDPHLCADIVRTYTDAFQTTEGSATGWGNESVNCMAKHWPGGGSGEGGRDAHFCYGKYSIYPGENIGDHILPFTEGVWNLEGPTAKCSAVMPYYTISYGLDPSGKNVGNNYSKYVITDLLRDKYSYNGVVCTDWAVTRNNTGVSIKDGMPWGAELLTIDERHYEILKAGVDQFGGNNDKKPVLAAYQMWCDEFGKESADERFRTSVVRILQNIFRVGLFENPYVVPQETAELVGCDAFVKEGYNAQLKSVVMIKNQDSSLPQAKGMKVYMPKRHYPASIPFFGREAKRNKEYWDYPVDTTLVNRYYEYVEDPAEADFAIVKILSPEGNWGYLDEDVKKGGNGYMPISLQYTDYTAANARKSSIAGGDPKESFTNRSYRGKTEKTYNLDDLKSVQETKRLMGDKPVVVIVQTDRPFVPEFEPYADAILLGFGVSNQAVLDIVSGEFEPYGLLPLQLPADMETVEKQFEDVPRDMKCHIDSEGNAYDFAFGLNWSGVINDWRVEKYSSKEYVTPTICPEPRSHKVSQTHYNKLETVSVACGDPEAVHWAERYLGEWYGKQAPEVVASGRRTSYMEEEEYRLEIDSNSVKVTARTLQGVRYALYTLRQLAIPSRGTQEVEGWIVPCADIEDMPQMDFRGMHVCWFQENEVWQIERFIRMAAYYKLNYVVIESWGTFDSKVAPWLGWPDKSMTLKEIKRLKALADDLGVTLIPQFNVFGHATMSRVATGKHATLDLKPEYQSYFEPLAGWNWCLSNPCTKELQKAVIKELYEAFDRPPYFHIGCDEASTPSCPDCITRSYSTLFLEHVKEMNEYVKSLGARTMMWHDMLIDRDDPRWEGLHAKGTAETASIVNSLPKDVVICDWYYRKARQTYPSLDYFKELDFDVIACPWDNNEGTVSQCHHANKIGAYGILGTLWQHFYGKWMIDIYFNVSNLAWNDDATLKVHGNPYLNQYMVHTHLRQVGWDMGLSDSRQTGMYYDQVPPEPYFPL